MVCLSVRLSWVWLRCPHQSLFVGGFATGHGRPCRSSCLVRGSQLCLRRLEGPCHRRRNRRSACGVPRADAARACFAAPIFIIRDVRTFAEQESNAAGGAPRRADPDAAAAEREAMDQV